MASPRKRILIVTPPGYGHVLALIPLAWALRSAGHHVIVATCGVSVSAATRAGLTSVNVAPGLNLTALYAKHRAGFATSVPETGDSAAAVATPSIFTDLCDATADAVGQVAQRWTADLILYSPDAPAGLIAAARCGVPAVFLGLGLCYTPAFMQRSLHPTLRRVVERHAVPVDVAPAAWIDVSPPSLRAGPATGMAMRWIDYSGGSVVDRSDLAGATGARPVVVTFGTVIPHVYGPAPMRAVIDAARAVDATFLLAHATARAADLGPLPPHVQSTSWLPLDVVLPRCRALVHHGGSGTTLAALAAGIPQLILPYGADQFANAHAARQRGVALAPDDRRAQPELLRRLLDDEALRAAAAEVRAEIAGMPPPADIVAPLVAIAA